MINLQSLLEQYLPFVKERKLPLALGLAGLIFFIYGLIALFLPHKESQSFVLGSEETQVSQPPPKVQLKILVDVEGAVARPGVYKLSKDARVQDGLIAAGGLSDEADRKWVATHLNLALLLHDGGKIYIPVLGEASTAQSGSIASSSDEQGSHVININTASLEELDSLSGIGQTTAQRIVDNRPYGDVQDLVTKKLVGKKVFDNIKDKITIN